MTGPGAMWTVVVAAALTLACGGNRHDAFPLEDGFQPLEASTAPAPAAVAGDAHPEQLETLTGIDRGSSPRHYYAHAHGFVKAPLLQTWAAMKDPTVCAFPKGKVDRSQVEPPDPGEQAFPVAFKIHYWASRFVFTVDWEISWRGGALQGTLDAPVQLGLRSQKTDGTTYITQQSSSITAQAVDVDPGVTEVEMVAWLNSAESDEATVKGTLTDYWAALLAKVHAPP